MAFKNFTIILVTAAVSFCSCAKISVSGVMVSANFYVEEAFTGIVVDGPMEVELSATAERIAVTADSNILPYVDLDFEDGVLSISYDDDVKFKEEPSGTRIVVPAPVQISSVRAEGAANILCNSLQTTVLDVSLKKSSSFTGKISAEGLNVQLSLSSVFAASGTVHSCKAELSGSSKFTGRDESYVQVKEQTTVTLTESSSAALYTDGTITGTLNGASTLYYSGNANCSVTAIGSTIEKF